MGALDYRGCGGSIYVVEGMVHRRRIDIRSTYVAAVSGKRHLLALSVDASRCPSESSEIRFTKDLYFSEEPFCASEKSLLPRNAVRNASLPGKFMKMCTVPFIVTY